MKIENLKGWRKTAARRRFAMIGAMAALISISPPSLGFLPDLSYKNADEAEAEKWQEGEYETPAFPEKSNLFRFYIDAPTSNRFMLDESTLSIGKDDVVRYVLVIQAEGGAETVTFEGIHCHSGKYRIYAFGQPDGTWTPARNDDWRIIAAIQPRAALLENYFCDGPAVPASRSALLRQIRNPDRGRP